MQGFRERCFRNESRPRRRLSEKVRLRWLRVGIRNPNGRTGPLPSGKAWRAPSGSRLTFDTMVAQYPFALDEIWLAAKGESGASELCLLAGIVGAGGKR